MQSRRIRSLGAVSSLALIASFPTAGFAQSADPQSADEVSEGAAADSGAIVVTGTRLQSSGFDAPTPVSAVTDAEIKQAAPSTIADFVNQLPALSGSRSPRTTKGGISGGLAGGNFLNLRNLGLERTLVLLDGRRATPSTLTGAVDANMLPSALIKRIDVVTGGASAAWGSDAVAGVINFVLDREFTGVKGEIQGGISGQGDGGNYSAELSAGTSFADGRGHVMISGRYGKMNGAYLRDRNWFQAYKIVPNPLFGQAGQSRFLSSPWSTVDRSANGHVLSGPLAGYYFDAQGNLAGTNFPRAGVTSIYYTGDEAAYSRFADQSRVGYASLPMEQWSVFGRASYDVSDSVNVYVQGMASSMETEAPIANYWTGYPAVQRDNFYLPTAVRDAMVANNVTTLPLGIAYSKLGFINNRTLRDNFDLIGGLEGKFGGDWKWDAYVKYGSSKSKTRAEDMPRPAALALAFDAVANPSNPSQPICRSTLTAPTNGCVPINPFGSQPVTGAALANVVGVSTWDVDYTQTVAAANVSGNLFDLPAGAVSAAFGAEYREEKANAVADPISQVNGFWAGNFKNFTGKYDVKEVYGEIGVPVFADSALGRGLNLNFAGRLTDYSTSGSVFTWKAGFRYEVVDGLVFRLTRSRDVRAPNLQELFQPGVVGNQGIRDPFVNADTRVTQTTSGNTALKPEKADTLTAGVVFTPTFAPGLKFSIDYYNIDIKQAIATNSSQFIVDRCFAGDTTFCSAVTRDGTGAVTAVNLKPFNALVESARGLDFEMSYRTDVGAGSLELRTLANYVSKLDIVSPTNVIHRAGEVGNNSGAAEGTPSWKIMASATYAAEPLTVQLRGRFIGASKQDRQWTSADINRNDVPAIFYLDAFVGYDFKVGSTKAQVFIAGDNLLDKAPPVVTTNDTANSVSTGTNPFIYDVMGRMLRAGIKFDF